MRLSPDGKPAERPGDSDTPRLIIINNENVPPENQVFLTSKNIEKLGAIEKRLQRAQAAGRQAMLAAIEDRELRDLANQALVDAGVIKAKAKTPQTVQGQIDRELDDLFADMEGGRIRNEKAA